MMAVVYKTKKEQSSVMARENVHIGKSLAQAYDLFA